MARLEDESRDFCAKLLHGEAYEIIFGGSCCGKRPISASLRSRVRSCILAVNIFHDRFFHARYCNLFIYEANIFSFSFFFQVNALDQWMIHSFSSSFDIKYFVIKRFRLLRLH